MMPTERAEPTRADLDAVAWRFLRSEYASPTYSDWPLDRRLDSFLRREGDTEICMDGGTYSLLLDRVMANIGAAVRNQRSPAGTAE